MWVVIGLKFVIEIIYLLYYVLVNDIGLFKDY